MKLVTRAEWGARSATSRTPAPGMSRGVGVHWLGPGSSRSNHSQCAAQMREVQAFHMGPSRGWADFAYNAAACRHGYVFEGRGPKVRNAANGGGKRASLDANAAWASVCYLEGTDGPGLTPEGQDAINDAAEWLGVAGGEWLGHRDFLNTECPGDRLYGWVHSGHPRGNGAPSIPRPDAPAPAKEDDLLFSPSPVACRHLIAMHSQLLMTAESKRHGTVTQQPANGSLSQRWMVWGHKDGSVSFIVRDEKWNEGLALDVPNGVGKDGTVLQVFPFDANPAQRFFIETVAPGIGIVVPAVARAHAVDLFGADMAAGGVFGLWTRHGDLHQRLMGAPTV